MIVAVLLALHGVADAQTTGGVAGGGGSTGGGTGGGGTGVATPTGSDLGGRSGPDSWPGLLALAGAGVLVMGALAIARPQRRSRGVSPRDVRLQQIRVVVDRDARERVQLGLRAIARDANTRTNAGRVALVHDASLLLRRVRASWVYGGIETSPAMTRIDARRAIDRAAAEARVTFDVERISNVDGALVDEPASASELEQGLVVATILVAARDELVRAEAIDRAAIEAALAWLGNLLPGDVTAAYVIWSPADASEPLDSLMLEARLPGTLTRLPDATVGTLACAHCGSRYPAEERRCSHCGSHVPAAYTESTRLTP